MRRAARARLGVSDGAFLVGTAAASGIPTGARGTTAAQPGASAPIGGGGGVRSGGGGGEIVFLFALLAAGAVAYVVFASRAKKGPASAPVALGLQQPNPEPVRSSRMFGYRVSGPNGTAEGELALPCVVGRASSADLMVDDDEISREHVRISAAGDGFMVEDLGSRNGLYSGDRRVESLRARPGDEFRIGRTTVGLLR